MTISQFINKIKSQPEQINFKEVIQVIDTNYQYHPAQFSNGIGPDLLINEAGKNEGSCKIFAFALLNHLNEKDTLACFGDFYRIDVLQHPDNTDHTNIRNFIKYGWDGIQFDSTALEPKS